MISLNELLSLPDGQLVHRYDLIVIPPPVITQGAIRALRLQCTQVTIPDRTIEPAEVNVAAYTIAYAGRNVVGKDLQASFFENGNATINRTFRIWEYQCNNRETGTGVPKREYAGRLRIIMMGQTGERTQEYEALNAWPTQIPGGSLDGSQTQVLIQQVTFRIDELRTIYDGGAPA